MEKTSQEQWDEFREWLARGEQAGTDLQGWIESGLSSRIDGAPFADIDLETGAIQAEFQQRWMTFTAWLDAAPPFVMKGLEANGWHRNDMSSPDAA